MGRKAKRRKTKPICLLNGDCYFQKRNAHSMFKRCSWQSTCNQKGPIHSGGRTMEQMRAKQFADAAFRIGVVKP